LWRLGSKELYRISDVSRLRVLVRVPQAYARSIQNGQSAEIAVPELRGKTFSAKLVRTSGSIDAASRTLLAELEVDNGKGELLAGSYAQVLLPGAKAESPLTVSANALIFRSEGAQVAVVEEGGLVRLVKVVLGRDFGSTVELIEGVTAASRVVLNPPDSLTDGIRVEVVE
jgi:RND family efflux transporter MFP subunit